MIASDKTLNSKQICAILEMCAQTGVKVFSYAGLEVTFADAGLESPAIPQDETKQQFPPQVHFPVPVIEKATEPSPAPDADEYDYLLAVEDPVAFEAAQLREDAHG